MSAWATTGRLRETLNELIDEEMFADLRVHGNSHWSLRWLAITAMVWAVSGEAGLVERFHQTLVVVSAWGAKGLGACSYQGLMKALVRWTDVLRPRVLHRLRQRLETAGQHQGPRHGWQLFAVDGTRLAVPRTQANEEACQPTVRRRRPPSRRLPAQPQLWLTVMWQVSLGVVWDWRYGPTGSNERAHLVEMLDGLPTQTLIVADAGFQGYHYWRTLQDRGYGFLIRVGQNVRLLQRLGLARMNGQSVALWPDRERRRGEPPLLLRLWELQGPRSTVYVVTNILDAERLTPAMVAEFYRARWGVEVFFRNFKQTFGRCQLHSHAPQNLACELEWSLLGWACVELIAVRAALEQGRDPTRISPAAALVTLRDEIRRQSAAAPRLWLTQDKDDGYPRRCKAIRNWPRKKLHKPAGPPQLRPLDDELRQALKLYIQTLY